MIASEIIALAAFLVACFVTASSGAIFRPGRWYEGLSKPAWCPPDWLFAPVWAVLYIAIAVSGWLVWRAVGFEGATFALTLYAIQLALNAGWSAIFFGLRRPDLAFLEVIALWLSIAAIIVAFFPIDRLAAYLMIPYLFWVSFAMVLNYRIWRLNAVDAA